MTEKERDLMIKDLCARLPYHPAFKTGEGVGLDYVVEKIKNSLLDKREYQVTINDSFLLDRCRLCLRPFSSMTEEEIERYHNFCETDDGEYTGEIMYFDTCESIDYLNSIHIDYRGLIPMGLAVEAPEDIYKNKEEKK